MIKRVILEKEELLSEIASSLNVGEVNVKYGVIEKIIEGEELITDIIEILSDCLNEDIERLIYSITNFYTYEDNLIKIELSDLSTYINNLYNVTITEIYDFFESNIFGDMKECIAFELI